MRRRSEQGFTLIELLIVVAVIGIIAAVAVPGLLRARASANEASAIGSLRAINSSQAVYANTCGDTLYAATLVDLAIEPEPGTAAFISPDLGAGPSVSKSGYIVEMVGTPVNDPPTPSCNGGQMASGYYSTASPNAAGFSGTRYFWTNASGAIYTQPTAFASTNEVSGPDGDPAATILR